jgi:hypothetical protein
MRPLLGTSICSKFNITWPPNPDRRRTRPKRGRTSKKAAASVPIADLEGEWEEEREQRNEYARKRKGEAESHMGLKAFKKVLAIPRGQRSSRQQEEVRAHVRRQEQRKMKHRQSRVVLVNQGSAALDAATKSRLNVREVEPVNIGRARQKEEERLRELRVRGPGLIRIVGAKGVVTAAAGTPEPSPAKESNGKTQFTKLLRAIVHEFKVGRMHVHAYVDVVECLHNNAIPGAVKVKELSRLRTAMVDQGRTVDPDGAWAQKTFEHAKGWKGNGIILLVVMAAIVVSFDAVICGYHPVLKLERAGDVIQCSLRYTLGGRSVVLFGVPEARYFHVVGYFLRLKNFAKSDGWKGNGDGIYTYVMWIFGIASYGIRTSMVAVCRRLYQPILYCRDGIIRRLPSPTADEPGDVDVYVLSISGVKSPLSLAYAAFIRLLLMMGGIEPNPGPTGCYNCGKEGHLARNCPEAPKKGKKGPAVAKHCAICEAYYYPGKTKDLHGQRQSSSDHQLAASSRIDNWDVPGERPARVTLSHLRIYLLYKECVTHVGQAPSMEISVHDESTVMFVRMEEWLKAGKLAGTDIPARVVDVFKRNHFSSVPSPQAAPSAASGEQLTVIPSAPDLSQAAATPVPASGDRKETNLKEKEPEVEVLQTSGCSKTPSAPEEVPVREHSASVPAEKSAKQALATPAPSPSINGGGGSETPGLERAQSSALRAPVLDGYRLSDQLVKPAEGKPRSELSKFVEAYTRVEPLEVNQSFVLHEYQGERRVLSWRAVTEAKQAYWEGVVTAVVPKKRSRLMMLVWAAMTIAATCIVLSAPALCSYTEFSTVPELPHFLRYKDGYTAEPLTLRHLIPRWMGGQYRFSRPTGEESESLWDIYRKVAPASSTWFLTRNETWFAYRDDFSSAVAALIAKFTTVPVYGFHGPHGSGFNVSLMGVLCKTVDFERGARVKVQWGKWRTEVDGKFAVSSIAYPLVLVVCALLFYLLTSPSTRVIQLRYIPHYSAYLISEFNKKADQAAVRSALRQKSLRFAAFPLADVDLVKCLEDSESVALWAVCLRDAPGFL